MFHTFLCSCWFHKVPSIVHSEQGVLKCHASDDGHTDQKDYLTCQINMFLKCSPNRSSPEIKGNEPKMVSKVLGLRTGLATYVF